MLSSVCHVLFYMLRVDCVCCCFFFQAEDGIRNLVRSRGLGDVYKRQEVDAILLALQRREGRSSPADSTLAAVAAAVVSDFVPVYHPDAFTADDAVPIVVRAGEELSLIHI